MPSCGTGLVQFHWEEDSDHLEVINNGFVYAVLSREGLRNYLGLLYHHLPYGSLDQVSPYHGRLTCGQMTYYSVVSHREDLLIFCCFRLTELCHQCCHELPTPLVVRL